MGDRKYVTEVVKEGKRVRWPKRDQFIPAFVSAVIICLFCALVLSLEDFAAGSLIGQLKELFKSIGSRPASNETVEAIRMFLGM